MKNKGIEKTIQDIRKIVRYQEVDGVRPIDPTYMEIMVDVSLDAIPNLVSQSNNDCLDGFMNYLIKAIVGGGDTVIHVRVIKEIVKQYKEEHGK